MLRERNITDVVALNSTLSEDQELRARERIRSGTVRIVYTTPESSKTKPSWRSSKGYGFRSSSSTRRTASANGDTTFGRPILRWAGSSRGWSPDGARVDGYGHASVREDILHQLGIDQVKPIVRGFDRPNLIYESRKAERKPIIQISVGLFEGPSSEGHRHHLHGDDQKCIGGSALPDA